MTSDPSRLVSARLLKDPGVGFIESQLHERDFVAVESRGFVPDVALLKQADDGDCVAEASACSLAPDADSDQAFAKFMNW